MGKQPLGAPRRSPAWRRYVRFWGSDPARDLDDEVRFHLAARYDEYIALGMTPAQARAETDRRFGDVVRVRDECASIETQWTRRRSMIEIVKSAGADMRYALRQFRRNASLNAAAILCLALGIGANTAIFSVVNGVLYRPLPVREPDQLLLVGEGLPMFSDENFGVISLPEYADYRRLEPATFSGSAIYEPADYALSGAGGDPERVKTLRGSANLLDVIGVVPAHGRGFAAADADTSAPPVVIISDALWHRRFNADPGVVGRRVDVEGRPATVIGVLPSSFQFPLPGVGGQPADLFVPIRFTVTMEQLRGNSYNTWLVARLAPGVSVLAARHAVASLAASLPKLHPNFYGPDWKTTADAFPLRDRAVKDVRRPLLILLAAVGLVLLTACINVSGLLLARAEARAREIAVRRTLGATFWRLAQQSLAESALLVGVGGALGVIVAVWVVGVLAAHAPREMLHGYALSIDGRVLGVTAAIAIVTTVAFSLVPAFSGNRRALASSMNEAGRGSTSGFARQRGRRLLVVTQISLALVLSTAAGLMIRSFARVREVDLGFQPQHLVTFRTGLPAARYPTATSIIQFEQRLADGLRQIPGVRTASLTNNLPLSGPWRLSFSIEGVTLAKIPIASGEVVFPQYFEAMGIPVRAGRGLSASDVADALPVVVVNEAVARRYFAGRSVVGKRIKWGSPESRHPWLTIAGVTADVRQHGIDQSADAEIYLPALQQDSTGVVGFLRGPAFVVRGEGDSRALMTAVQRVVRRLDPALPIVGLQPMTDVVDTSMETRTFNTLLLAAFALLALGLASIGVYGLIAYSVVQRTREIGVRIAVGATPGRVVRGVLGQGLRLASIGVGVGIATALLLTRLMRSLLFDVSPFDLTSLVAAATVLFVVALLAGYLPARRAARIDPQTALRAE